MPEPKSKPSVLKTISRLLAITLIGVVALYSWHNDNQKKILAGKDAELSESSQRLADAERKLAEAEEVSIALRAENQELVDERDADVQAMKKLQGEMEALETRHAQAIAAEQQKASEAYAELEERLEKANRQIATQEPQGTEMTAAQDARALEREHQLNKKLDFYRKALEGSDSERAAQLVGLELKVAEDQRAVEQAREAMTRKESDLEEQLAKANQTIAERDQALSEARKTLKEVQTQLAQELTARTAPQDRTQPTEAADKEADTGADAVKDANKADTSTMDGAQDKISELTDRLQAETAALEALRQKHKTTVSDLRGALEATKQTLAGAEAELNATKEAAARAQESQEKQLAKAQSKLEDLEQTLAQTRQKAARDLAASQHESEEAVATARRTFSELSKLGGQQTERGMLLNLAEEVLRFGINKADLPQGELPSLDQIAKLLVEHPELAVRIEGHTDSMGPDETNLGLSQRRADAVKQALVERGVASERIISEGIGAARPIADNARSEGRSKNRRVEIYVVEN